MLNLGLQMEELIFELADTHLFFNDLEVQRYIQTAVAMAGKEFSGFFSVAHNSWYKPDELDD